MQLTVVRHLGTDLPWEWRIGAAADSERDHLCRMFATLPEQAMLVLDAGFTGFDLLQAIDQSNRSFVIRAAGNTTLIHDGDFDVERRGEERVRLWPKNQQCTQPPLELRLILVKKKGRRGQDVCLMTNVIDSRQRSRRSAARLYRMRWGDEAAFRGLEQTMNHRKMRSASPRRAYMELMRSMIARTILGLLNVKTLIARNIHPHRASLAKAAKAIQRWMRRLPGIDNFADHNHSLMADLRAAIRDPPRNPTTKHARNHPNKKYDPLPGPPKLRQTTPKERQLAASHATTET